MQHRAVAKSAHGPHQECRHAKLRAHVIQLRLEEVAKSAPAGEEPPWTIMPAVTSQDVACYKQLEKRGSA